MRIEEEAKWQVDGSCIGEQAMVVESHPFDCALEGFFAKSAKGWGTPPRAS